MHCLRKKQVMLISNNNMLIKAYMYTIIDPSVVYCD